MLFRSKIISQERFIVENLTEWLTEDLGEVNEWLKKEKTIEEIEKESKKGIQELKTTATSVQKAGVKTAAFLPLDFYTLYEGLTGGDKNEKYEQLLKKESKATTLEGIKEILGIDFSKNVQSNSDTLKAIGAMLTRKVHGSGGQAKAVKEKINELCEFSSKPGITMTDTQFRDHVKQLFTFIKDMHDNIDIFFQEASKETTDPEDSGLNTAIKKLTGTLSEEELFEPIPNNFFVNIYDTEMALTIKSTETTIDLRGFEDITFKPSANSDPSKILTDKGFKEEFKSQNDLFKNDKQVKENIEVFQNTERKMKDNNKIILKKEVQATSIFTQYKDLIVKIGIECKILAPEED